MKKNILLLIVFCHTTINAQSEIVVAGSQNLKNSLTNWVIGSIYISTNTPEKILKSDDLSENISNKTDYYVYPNPFLDKIKIEATSNEVKSIILLYNIQGKKIFSGKLNKRAELNLMEFPAGLYFLRINTKTYKLIKL